MADKPTTPKQNSPNPVVTKKMIKVELPEEVWQVVSNSLTSEMKNVKKLNYEYPNLWRAQDDIVEYLNNAISAINDAVAEQN